MKDRNLIREAHVQDAGQVSDMNGDIESWERQHREGDDIFTRSYRHVYPHQARGQLLRHSTLSTAPQRELERRSSYARPSSSGHDRPHYQAERRAISYSQSATLEETKRPKWPPHGFTPQSSLNQIEAEEYICAGASTFKGYRDAVPHAPGKYRFYAVMEAEHTHRTDRAALTNSAFKDCSLTVTGPGNEAFPWVALEQPCMAYAFGMSPATTTLNFFVGKSGCLSTELHYASNARPKKIKLIAILERLRTLETGLEDDDPVDLYGYLYGTLIEDPDANTDPHYGMERQM
ncbi:hypothetical protein LTS18_009484, partial [Coniosporium uncinatum]